MPRFTFRLRHYLGVLLLVLLLPASLAGWVSLAGGLALLAAGCLLLLIFGARQRACLARRCERMRARQADVSASLGRMHEELAHLLALANQIGALSNESDTALQHQQCKLDQAMVAFARIKVEGQQLADDAREVGSESRQSMRLALKGQAGLSATLMAFRSVDRVVLAASAPQAALAQEVRVLARQGRDQTYDANLALAGISAAAGSIEERGLSIAVACEAQACGVEALDQALADIQRLAFTSAWRTRQVRAASEVLGLEAARLDRRLRDCPWNHDLQQDAGGVHAAVQDPDPSLPHADEVPGQGPGAR